MICAEHLCYVHALFRAILFSPPKVSWVSQKQSNMCGCSLYKRNCKIRNVDFCFMKMRNGEAQRILSLFRHWGFPSLTPSSILSAANPPPLRSVKTRNASFLSLLQAWPVEVRAFPGIFLSVIQKGISRTPCLVPLPISRKAGKMAYKENKTLINIVVYYIW